jgi:Zn-finger nucleic acid-binding protein
MARCPVCSTLLFRRRVDGIELDGCPACGGVFFDKGELNQLVRKPETLRRVDSEFQPVETAMAPQRTGICPRCAHPLKAFEHPSLPGIQVDGCHGCKGIWLDHGEPTAIADRLAPPAPAAPSPVPEETLPATPIGIAPQLMAYAPAPLPTMQAAPAIDASAALARNRADPTATAGLPLVRGQPAGSLSEGNWLDRILRALRFLGNSFSLALEQPALLYPLLAGALFNIVLCFASVSWVLRKMQDGASAEAAMRVAQANVGRWLQGNYGLLIGGLVLTLVLGHLINNVIMGMTVSMIDAWLKGLKVSASTAFRDVLKNLFAIIGLAVIGAIVDIVVSLLRGSGDRRSIGGAVLNSITRAIAAAIEAAWTVLHFLLLPVIMIEDTGLGNALERVRRIHSSSLLPIAVGEVGLKAVQGLATLALTALVMAFGWLAWPFDPDTAVRLAFGVIACAILIGVPMSFARGAYYTCLYLWAAEREQKGEKACAPTPLATALAA